MPEAAPIIVAALFGGEDQAEFERLRRAYFPPERNQIAAHLTLFHHLAPGLADALDSRLADITASEEAPSAELAGLINLGRGVAIRIRSAGLAVIRDELAEAFDGMLVPQDRAGWRPHVTIQNKVAPHEARALLQMLAPTLPLRPVEIVGLASYWYRDGPWETRHRHFFRPVSRSGRPRRS